MMVIGLPFGALEIGGALGIPKDVRVEQGLVGLGGLLIMGRALCMELKGGLEALQGLVDLKTGINISTTGQAEVRVDR